MEFGGGTAVDVPEYKVADEHSVAAERAVLLIVDMQNDFVSPDGALAVPDAPDTVATIQELRTQAHEAGVPVWFTQDTHHDGDPEYDIWGKHVAYGSWGWEIIDELQPDRDAGELVFRKSRYDGFYGTELDHYLRMHHRDTLVICGTVANICVHYTAASAGLRYLDVIHPVEALSALTAFDLHAALRQASFLFQATLVRTDGLRYT